ncbi:site-specific DNA-methyltransferase [Helicobacter bilis]|uniref:DNA methyltransferase n=1 Tax=Helicobacter bilis TaxID=37372 RepID=UPI0026F030EE|nr:site-specific DNA-methyltransferase [Helicobacter bilis]MCI7410152.1 site-specific DNA-methyltransferase [Helicobacter bilis]MDD7297132.1 site-specific DNA-methyltransferase [Helicobacter bilis]MDY4401061.1 site-specific DNA-methyltransferase [Helicobacter bilis]
MQKATHKEHTLLQILQEKFQSIENLRTLAIDSNRELLSFLLESSEFRERFFTRVDSVAVFEKDKFLDFLKLRMLNKSYTAFSNKIGLQLESSFENTSKVVLNFPFKDCVLKGAQSRDEQKSKEIFFNEVLARSEIDILFSPKALQNFELIGQGDLKENLNNANLLIKGNNLLALHSLKKKFANQVKLIYIDPPYNTGNDSFNYNDNFNHSTWLTFMKNRLEIAREFLRDDGVIFIQCDDNEQAYLKVLCDEIFGRENFVCNFACIVAPAGTQSSVFVAQQHNYCLAYAKNKSNLTLFNIANTEQELKEKYKEKDKYGFYYSERLWKRGQGGKKEDVPSLHFPVYYDEIKDKIYIDSEAKNVKNLIKIIPYQTKGVLGRWTWSKEKMLNEKHKLIVRKVNNEYVLHKKNYRQDDKGKLPYSVITSDIARTEIGSLEIKEIFNDKVFNYPKSEKFLKRIIEISTQEGDLIMDFFAGSGTTLAVAHKMNRRWIGIEQMEYIESITKERLKKVINGEQGGISKAVDWQGGGSFIYAELMPLNAIYKERIKNLACHTEPIHCYAEFAPCHTERSEVSQNTESTRDLHKDISLSLNMTNPQKDFSFATQTQNDKVEESRNDKGYFANAQYDKIEKELDSIYNDLETKAFVDYRVDIQAMLKDREFYALSLDEKRKVLYAILDSNMDYVLYDDIDDSEYGVSDELRELNRIFYGENDE